MLTAGYFVVLRPNDKEFPHNTTYRGIYRMPPWRQDLYETRRLSDPYLHDHSMDDSLLLPAVEKAWAIRDGFLPNYPVDQLEIIYVDRSSHVDDASTKTFLGFDVAAPGPPYYSIVGDWPHRDSLDAHKSKLGSTGLFRVGSDAESFLAACLSARVPDVDDTFRVWRIELVEDERA
jgi:hypothetical protein